MLRNPWPGVQTPQVLGCSGLRVAEPLVRGSNPYGAGVSLQGWRLGSHMSNQGTHWRRFPAQGTVGWRFASRTLGQGLKPLRGSAVGGWGPTCPIRIHLRVEIPGSTQQKRSASQSYRKNHPTLTGQDTRDCASLAQSVSHQQPPLTLQITGRRRHMVARQLKLRDGLIKPLL